MNKKTLATSSTCGPCMLLKNKIASLNLEVEIKDYTISGDMEFFTMHGIRSVPRLVVETDDGVTIIQGIDDIIEEIKKDA